MDQLEHISNPILKDWSIILSVGCIGLFIAIRWMVKFISSLQKASTDRSDIEISRVEKYLNSELSLSRAERKELSAEINKMQLQSIETMKDSTKLRLQLRQVVHRIRYLEKLLRECGIEFIPAVENYDDI